MICVKCQGDSLADCKCPDIEERLRALAGNPHIALTWCTKCLEHIERCKCSKEECDA